VALTAEQRRGLAEALAAIGFGMPGLRATDPAAAATASPS
jgi:hypothetical protein